jgi:hypothetical protein
MSEKELSLKITEYLNKISLGFNFKFIDDFCDIMNEYEKIFIEVKTDHFAPAQIMHAIARQGISDASYLGVADSRIVKLYRPPSFEKIRSFATSFDPTLIFSPSQADKPELNERAENILGEPSKIIRLEFSDSPFFYINKNNLDSVRAVTDKYKIEIDHLVNWLDGVGDVDSIKINKDGWLVNLERPSFFTNEGAEDKRKKEITEYGGHRKPKHIPIKSNDITWFESLRVRHEELADVLHEVDRLLPRKKRRERGVFWTEEEIGDKIADEILTLTKPDYVVEPCVGGGSLLKQIVPKVKGTMNDISPNHVENCRRIFDGYKWKYTTLDVVNSQTPDLVNGWKVPSGKRLLLYTNPPFGTSSTGKLVSKKEELTEKLSRQQFSSQSKATYPVILKKYGQGDLFLPIVGRLIEISIAQKNCCLAFFSPFGLFCGRKRYMPLLSALLRDFRFIKGYVFAGKYFHDINKTLPIGFSIWEYAPNTNAKPLDLHFEFIDKAGVSKEVQFKEMYLLKDGWRYRDGNKYVRRKTKGAIGIPRCERFNCPNHKLLCIDIKEGSGAELSPDNLRQKITLIPNIPSELVFGLWSCAVGKHVFGTSLSFSQHPIYFEQSYVHMPDFSKKESLEVLAYSALHVLVKNYAEEKIGFFGSNKIFRFGDDALTEAVEYLFKSYKDCPVYDTYSIGEVFELIKQSNVDTTKCRRGIIAEVSKRLAIIGYWDIVPFPSIVNNDAENLDKHF